jgi:vacuolar-type H+-ATPase subunit F/Vma7
MSRMLVITRPEFVVGFQLSGVNAYGADTVETAQELIENWLETGESGLLAIDDGIMEYLEAGVLERLEKSSRLFYIAIPGGKPLGPQVTHRHRIAAMIRQAIGFHITFKGEEKTDLEM